MIPTRYGAAHQALVDLDRPSLGSARTSRPSRPGLGGRGRPRPRRRAVAAFLALLLVVVSSMTVVVAPATAANQDSLSFGADQEPAATFGANDIVRIDGRISFVKGCAEGGVDDWVYPTTDVYVVAQGSASDGAKLEDVTGAMPNTIIEGSSVFSDEVIAMTVPGGHLGEGTYDVVYDACQDGKFDAGVDTVFPDVITVTLPAVLPPATGAIGAMKQEAAVDWVTWLATRYAMQKLFDLADKAINLQCEIGNSIGCAMKKLDYFDNIKKQFLALLLSQANHYRAIAQDPPDADFQQATRVVIDPFERDHTDSPATNATADALAPFAREVGLTEAVLHAVERYQGAIAAGDARWALIHAQEAANLSRALAALAPASAAGLQTLKAAITNDPVIVDAFDNGAAFARRVGTNGFTAAERRALLNAGRSRAEVSQLESDLRADRDTSIAGSEIAGRLADTIAAQADVATAAAAQALQWDAVIAAIQAGNHAPDATPTADAGGPYTVAAGASLTLGGSATGSIDSAGWDLNGDVGFDEATGLHPGVSFSTPGTHLIGLRVVADGGAKESIRYAVVKVTNSDAAPVLSPSPAARAVILTDGESVTFSDGAADSDGQSLGHSWTLDGQLVTMDETMPFTASTTFVGRHTVEATVSDGTSATRRSWLLVVLAKDEDADGWTATTDCDDTDTAVHPGAIELFGNGIDDDCDPGTADGPPGGLTGSMFSWGSNHNASIGIGYDGPIIVDSPAEIPDLDNVVRVDSIHAGGFAILDNGDLKGWGSNGSGQLGIGTVGGVSGFPVSPLGVGGAPGSKLTGVVDIDSGGGNIHAVAVRTDGSVISWGDNSQRQVGDGTTVDNRPYPVPVVTGPGGQPLTGVKDVEAGYSESYAIMTDGTVKAWGMIRCDGGTSPRIEPYPTDLTLLGGDVKQVASGNQWAMFLKKDGSVWSCGGFLPYAGRPLPRLEDVFKPGIVTGFGPGSGAVKIAVGSEGALILKADGSVWAWGNNANHSLDVIGVPGGQSANAPVQVPLPAGAPIVDIDMDGACNATVARADGSLLTWGCDFFGQAGTAGDANVGVSTPTVIPIPGRRVVQVSNSVWNTLVLTRPADDPEWTPPATWISASVADKTVSEGAGGSATVSISAALPHDVTIDWSTVAGTADPNDVDETSGTVTIPAGDTTASIHLPVNDDDIDEDSETFSIVLDHASDGIQLVRPEATGTITDDDAAPVVSISDASVDEGDTALTDAAVHLHLSHPSSRSVTVTVDTADGTAESPADYAAFTATVGFAPGQTDEYVHLAVAGDTTVEPDESFTAKLSEPIGVTLGDATASVSIADDDPLQLAVASPEVTEGTGGTTPATFTVALSPAPPAGSTVTVDFAVAGLSAAVPDDVAASSGTLTFAAGDGPKTVTVDVVGDDQVEGSEGFRLALSNARASDGRAVLPADDAPALIVDDDAAAPSPTPTPTPSPTPTPTPTPTPNPTPTPPADKPPVVDAGPDAAGNEGSPIALDATASDPDPGDVLTTSWTWSAASDVDAGTNCQLGSKTAIDTTITCTDDGTFTATLTVTDRAGQSASDSVMVKVANVAPTVDVTAPTDYTVVMVGSTVSASAALRDAGANDLVSCAIDWGDGSTGGIGRTAAASCTGSHAYASIGVETLGVTAIDDESATGTDSVLLVVDAPGTKVRGGGWVKPNAVRTSFGLVAEPNATGFDGEIQVNTDTGKFHGKSVTSLVVSGTAATLTGAGRWKGVDGYTYKVTVVDNRNGGGKKGLPDTFAIEIRNSAGTLVFSTSGPLQGGNLKVG